jgi:hypothetical protein
MSGHRKGNGHLRRTEEAQRRIMELRRSNAAQPHKNKSKYSRKVKHRGMDPR